MNAFMLTLLMTNRTLVLIEPGFKVIQPQIVGL